MVKQSSPTTPKDKPAKPPRTKPLLLSLDYFLHQPHDKYAKYVLSHREVAIEVVRYVLDPALFVTLVLPTFDVDVSSFLDEKMDEYHADTVYRCTCKMVTGGSVEIRFVFENKSDQPGDEALAQMLHYKASSIAYNLRQNEKPAVTVSILVCHGDELAKKRTLLDLYPDELHPAWKQFVPNFNYCFLNVQSISEQAILSIAQNFLPNIFLALKYGRDKKYVEENFDKIIIFAPAGKGRKRIAQMLGSATLLYLCSAVSHDKKTIVKMVNQASQTQPQPVKSYIQHLLEEREEALMDGKIEGIKIGEKKGEEKGEKKAMKIAEAKARLEKERVVTNILLKFPQLTIEEVAEVCATETAFVKKIRAKVKKQHLS